jgi:hypothetical protein
MRPNSSWFDEIIDKDDQNLDDLPWETADTVFVSAIGVLVLLALVVGFLLGAWLA